jgi:ssDNA-binding replication factor A large subunit
MGRSPGCAYGTALPRKSIGPMSAIDHPDGLPEVRLKDLRAGLPPVHVLGRVVTASRKEITGKNDGRRHTVLSGLLSDGTATVRFTWWDPPAEGVDRGTVLRAVNAQVREFRERPELSFGWSTRIQPASDLELPSPDTVDLPLRGVAELDPHAEGFRLQVRVLDVAERTVTVGEERRVVHSGHLSDGTGSIPFTAWIDFRLKPGATVRIAGGYVRVYRGSLEVTLDERSHVEAIAPHLVPPTVAKTVASLSMGVLESRTGGAEEQTEGIVVGIGSPSGVVLRCPTCNRILQVRICRLHGAVEGTPDLRVRVVLDDGTGVATVNISRDLAEQLTGRSLRQLLDQLRRQPDPSLIEGELRNQLIGRRLRVRGRARVDEFGLSLFPTYCEEILANPDPSIDLLGRRLAERPR